MNSPLPHYLLFCDGNLPTAENAMGASGSKSSGRWKFVLESIESGEKFEASDRETGSTPDRTALIAVLRGLEALEQPSRVTLVTTSRYVFRGLQYGLNEWRANNYSWEHFGTVQPIRNADIWKRIDRTLSFHKVQCRWISQNQPDDVNMPDNSEASSANPNTENAAKENERDCYTTDPPQETAVSAQASTPHRSQRKHVKRAPACSVSATTSGRVFDAGRRSPTAVTNYVIAEVEKKNAPESELSTISTDESRASTPFSRIDSPIPSENDSTEPAESQPESIGPLPPKFLRKISNVRSRVWQALLRLDEEIEGYFRCLLLLEPRPPRRDS